MSNTGLMPIRQSWMRLLRGCIVIAIFTTSSLVVGEDEPAQRQFFEFKIRPLLVEKCQDCHSADDPQSKFASDSLEGLIRGGTRGPAVIPGKPGESLLISAVKHGEVLKMPPKEKLSAVQIADLTKWIETGVYWPDAAPVTMPPAKPTAEEPEFTAEQKSFWAFQRPQRPAIPDALRPGDFPAPIDRFLDVKLYAAGYAPAGRADQRILFRRATFDLSGLPPTWDEITEYLADDSPDAFERAIDRLLASPRYGEKWGRHWLDVARYGDSNGLDENLAFGNAYRYRDYVVAAFNADKPYDEFVRDQIAGDLQTASTDAESLEKLVATGFLSIGPKMLAEDDPVKMQMDIIDEQVDTLGKAFLGMTFGCARCHDHKFDPISAHDYYALAGIFKSTKTMDNFGVVARWQERPLATAEQIRDLQRQRDVIAGRQMQIQQVVNSTNETILTAARQHLGDYLLAAAQIERMEFQLAMTPPIGSQPDAGQRTGLILVEAEDFVRGNVTKDTTTHGVGIGVLVNRGEQPNFAEYEFDLPQAGPYQIELRYAAAESRPCQLSVNGRELKANAAAKTTGGWYPKEQSWHMEGVFELPAGKIVLRLQHPIYFPHIDKLLLAHVPDHPTPATFAKLDPEYLPTPALVDRWRKFFSRPESELPIEFAAWHAAVMEFQKGTLNDQLPQLKQLASDFQQRAAKEIAEPVGESALRKLLFDPQGAFVIPPGQEEGYPVEVAEQLKTLREEQKTLEAALPVFPETMSVADQTPEDHKIHLRGSHLTLGQTVPRRFPRIMAGDTTAIGSQGSGRLELADWLTRAEHPLTSRVIVNRLWTWHFGAGIVRTVDNFGLLGELPTHPELHDWLATEFPRRNWSIKAFHRLAMSSAAYQRDGRADDHQLEHDPDNRLWGRYSRRRLQIEELRDAMSVSAGTLDERLGGGLLTTENRKYVTSTANVNPDMYRTRRRSLYLPVVRSALFDVFQAFDFADPNVSSGERQSTTVAAQALFLMNSEFVSQESLALADELLAGMFANDQLQIQAAYHAVLGREPTESEVARIAEFLLETSGEDRRRVWQSVCRALMSTNEFVFVD